MQNHLTPKVAVVILNYGTKDCLKKYLPSVLKTNYDNLEIVVADNASKDDSVQFMQAEFPTVKLLQFHKNLGYAGGYNKALSLINAHYFVLLNSDVEVEPNWLQPLVDLAESDKRIGAIQPLILDLKKHSFYEYAGAAGGFIDYAGYPFCKGRIFDTIEQRAPELESTQEVFWASGACLFIQSAAFFEVNGLDNKFFAHMEEIDLCWRLKLNNYKVYVCAESSVYHLGGGTLASENPRKTYLNFHNNLAMLAKNLPKNKAIPILLWRLILDHVAAYRFLFKGKFAHFFAVAKAHFVFIINARFWLKNKRPKYTLLSLKGVYTNSIVFDYFLKKKKKWNALHPKSFS